jgi:hypothetical protein
LVPCNRFLLFYNHPIWTDGRLIKTLSTGERVFLLSLRWSRICCMKRSTESLV